MVPLGGADVLDHNPLHMFGFWPGLQAHVFVLLVCAEFLDNAGLLIEFRLLFRG